MNSLWVTEELPDEIAMDIFLRLPVKSLVRFGCISRSLCAAIRSSKFIAAHHFRQKRNLNLRILLRLSRTEFYVDRPYLATLSAEFLPAENIRMPFVDNSGVDPKVSGPCNGLLCLIDNFRIALWNPSTREFKHVPPSTVRRPPQREADWAGPVGFGFDCRSGDYKVIRFVDNTPAQEGMVPGEEIFYRVITQVELYCLSSNSWREIAAPEELAHGGGIWDGENGLYHWGGTGRDGGLILSFNMRDESFSTTALPEFKVDCLWDFVEHPNAAMAMIAYAHKGEEFFDLWVKKESGWMKELSLGPFPGVLRPLGLWKSGHLFLVSSGGELLVLDVETGEMKNTGVSGYPGRMNVTVYAESLVSIHGRAEHKENIVHEMIHQ